MQLRNQYGEHTTMGKAFSSMNFRYLCLLGTLGCHFVCAQSAYVPVHDLRIAVHLPFIQSILDRFDGMTYGARYAHGGAICSSPDVFVALEKPSLSDVP